MRKQIFQAICARLTERVPDIQFIDLWNNNVQTLSGGSVWPLPAVFVEFEPIEWRQQNNGARRGDVAVRLHLVTRAVSTHGTADPKMSDALGFLDLIDQINAAMQGLRGDNFSGFQLTTSATNHDHAELMESVERYTTSAQDITAVPKAAKVTGIAPTLRKG